jgi:hypothetical protein
MDTMDRRQVDARNLASLRSKVRCDLPRRNAKGTKALATRDHKEHRKEEQNFGRADTKGKGGIE